MESRAYVKKVLNKLLRINQYLMEGYENAARNIPFHEYAGITSLLYLMADESRFCYNEIKSMLKKYGVEGIENKDPDSRTKLLDSFTNEDIQSIVKTSERWEEEAISAYKDVLKNEPSLPGEIRRLIINQLQSMTVSHNRIKRYSDLLIPAKASA